MEFTDADVLMGRGKRVGEHPGNVEFREIMNLYRKEYVSANRTVKSAIARKAIAHIRDTGARFLEQVGPNGEWVLVEETRVIEKACQALREKVVPRSRKPQPKATKPPVKKKNPSTAKKSKTVKSSKTKARRSSPVLSESDDEDGALAILASMRKKIIQDESPILRIYQANDNDMLYKLFKFNRQHGHCAVPPDWADDTQLADWCTWQRQVYRETNAGYRKPLTKETERIEKLQDVGFVWDYDAWIWDRNYAALKLSPSQPPESVQIWLDDVRAQHREGRVSKARLEQLRRVGIVLY